MKQVVATVVSNTKVTSDFHLMGLESHEIAIEAKPGQFVMASCGENTSLPRPLGIHQRDNNKIAILFSVVGKGTDWLSRQQAGNTIKILGPLGNGFSINPASKNLLLVGGGIGIAPLVFLADTAKQNRNVILLMGAASAAKLLPDPVDSSTHGLLTGSHGLLTDRVLPWGITIHRCTDDGSKGYRGLVTHLLIEQQLIDWADQIFACGPLPMYKAMAQMPELKNKPVQVSLEVRMACGRGVCYGCTISTKQGLKKVCQDGPVFELDDIIWDDLSPVV